MSAYADELTERHPRELGPIDDDTTAGGMEEAADDREQRRLAGARWAHDDDKLSGGDLE